MVGQQSCRRISFGANSAVEMRQSLKCQDLSFTEIAKLVGERWQALSAAERGPCERKSQSLKEKFYAELAEYKKTVHYARYQEYLSEFKAKHNPPPPGGKSLSAFDVSVRC